MASLKINVNGVNVISPAELADFEKLHHKIFKNITFEIGANITSKYENGQIWTHVWHGGLVKEKVKRLQKFQFI